MDCMKCGFFAIVGSEEGTEYLGAKSILARIQRHSASAARRSPGPRSRGVHGEASST